MSHLAQSAPAARTSKNNMLPQGWLFQSRPDEYEWMRQEVNGESLIPWLMPRQALVILRV
jgi:hypothetical protein